MWRAILKNSAGGELDRVEAADENELRTKLVEQLVPDVFASWSLSNGDRIEIVEAD